MSLFLRPLLSRDLDDQNLAAIPLGKSTPHERGHDKVGAGHEQENRTVVDEPEN